MQKRLNRVDQGINPLDSACRLHDIAYTEHSSGQERHEADKILKKAAIARIKARDATFGERLAAVTVAGAMKLKTGLRKIGGGLKRRRPRRAGSTKRKRVVKRRAAVRCTGSGSGARVTFSRLIRGAQAGMTRQRPTTTASAIKAALMAARKLKRGKRVVGIPRVIKVPTFTGNGFARLIPILSGLASIGTIVNSVVGVLSSLKALRNKRQINAEQKIGSGLYLMPYRGSGRRGGSGLYLRPAKLKSFH